MITDETEPSGVCDRRCGEDLFKGDDKVSSRNKVLNNKLFFFHTYDGKLKCSHKPESEVIYQLDIKLTRKQT